MISRFEYKNIKWIDLESPTEEDIKNINEEFNIIPHVSEELRFPSEKSRVDIYKDYLYLILHFPKSTRNHSETDEIDFIIGKNFLITTHYGTINSLHEFSKIFQAGSILNKLNIEHAGNIFVYLLKKHYEDMELELERVSDSLEKIEFTIFEDRGSKAIEDLSKINKELIDFKKTMRMHREILNSFEKISTGYFGKEFSHQVTALLGSYERVWHELESNKDILTDLRQTSDSLFSARTNSIMRTLTVLTFITIPISIIANFGQNAKNIPIVGHQFDFWIILSFMAMFALGMIYVFKLKKWL